MLPILVPYPSLQESVDALPLHWCYKMNWIIGYEMRAGYRYSPSGRMWIYKSYHLAKYALLIMEKAEKVKVDFYNYWWARCYSDGKWQFPASFFIRRMKRDTGLPAWWGDETIHQNHRDYLISPRELQYPKSR